MSMRIVRKTGFIRKMHRSHKTLKNSMEKKITDQTLRKSSLDFYFSS